MKIPPKEALAQIIEEEVNRIIGEAQFKFSQLTPQLADLIFLCFEEKKKLAKKKSKK